MNLHSYPKVYAIGHAATQELFLDSVLVEEKIDGSQFSFCETAATIDGPELAIRSHGAEIHIVDGKASEKMFNLAVQTVQNIAGKLQTGWVYRGEFLAKPKHNNLNYGRVPAGNIILFDINVGEEQYLPYHTVAAEAERIGLEVVPKLHEGFIADPKDLLSLLDRESVLGGPIEGIVVKNYKRFGRDGKAVMGKFVTEKYKETASKEWKANNPMLGDVIESIIATLRSERRWEKAVERLRDNGTLLGEPADIGPLIKAVQADVEAEEKDWIKSKLEEWALPRILRASASGLPQWYKERLLNSAFSPGLAKLIEQEQANKVDKLSE